MKRFGVIVTAFAGFLLAFGSVSLAGYRHRGGPPGKGIHRPSKETSQRAPIATARPFLKIGLRHTIVPPRYRASR